MDQAAIQEFINHHVMHHSGASEGWNLPFGRWNWLEWLHYDAVMVFVIALLLILLGWRLRRSVQSLPKGIATIAESYVLFIRDHVVKPNLKTRTTAPLISFFATLFAFILSANLLGLIPIFSTATGNVNVTAGLATCFMIVALGSVIKFGGIGGLKTAFVPEGLPGVMAPVMAVLEVISFFSRVFALTIRLFCNLLAGHIVVYSLLGVIVLFGLPAAPMLLMTVLMLFFELFVAFLQAYIFTLLSAIFVGIMVNPEH